MEWYTEEGDSPVYDNIWMYSTDSLSSSGRNSRMNNGGHLILQD